ncbi:hypothetical protein B0H17DRAFT_1144047 [Mycena rosella]|uniref:Uncharacterized protein n=1 Tax=Mycena rosella TaxID=1033263 RepID=A0AAD7CTZ4_MYCRO|nr:hypothetical protein B0H17DRAFT_1144047 [Mycena rosella]
MAPLNITSVASSASATASALLPSSTPTLNSTMTSPFFDPNPPVAVPDWAGYTGIVLFACIVIFQFYSAVNRSPAEPAYEALSTGNPAPHLGASPIVRVPSTAGAEDAIFQFATLKTMKHARGIELVEGPLRRRRPRRADRALDAESVVQDARKSELEPCWGSCAGLYGRDTYSRHCCTNKILVQKLDSGDQAEVDAVGLLSCNLHTSMIPRLHVADAPAYGGSLNLQFSLPNAKAHRLPARNNYIKTLPRHFPTRFRRRDRAGQALGFGFNFILSLTPGVNRPSTIGDRGLSWIQTGLASAMKPTGAGFAFVKFGFSRTAVSLPTLELVQFNVRGPTHLTQIAFDLRAQNRNTIEHPLVLGTLRHPGLNSANSAILEPYLSIYLCYP